MNLLQRRTTQPRQLFVRRGLSWAQPWGCPYGRATRRASALVTRGTHPGYSERAGPRAAAVAPSVGNASSGVLFFSALPAGVVSTVRVIVVACRRRVPRAADTAPRLHAARAAVCSMGAVADMAALTKGTSITAVGLHSSLIFWGRAEHKLAARVPRRRRVRVQLSAGAVLPHRPARRCARSLSSSFQRPPIDALASN
jgi:hypothetical protein